MNVVYATPRLIITNISNKTVTLLGIYSLLPSETVDLFKAIEGLDQGIVLSALTNPTGDIYIEAEIKGSIKIDSISLSYSDNSLINYNNLNTINTPANGNVLSFQAPGEFKWINSATQVSVAHPLITTGDVISIPPASASQDGYLAKEDFASFVAGSKRTQRIWQYQDFSAPLSSSLTLTTFSNGTGLSFDSSYIISDSATIVLTSDNSKPPSTTISIPGRWLPANRVEVSSQIGTTVVLNNTPHSSLNCRVWYLASIPSYIPLPNDYIEAPQFVARGSLNTLDDIYVNDEGNETIYGIKTFNSQSVFNSSIKIPSGALDGYVLTSDSSGSASWQEAPGASGSGITITQHENTDSLVHNLAENYYEEYIYSGTKVTGIIEWTNSGKTIKVRESQYIYSGTQVTQEINIQYNSIGVEIQRLTSNYSYSGAKVASIDVTESI